MKKYLFALYVSIALVYPLAAQDIWAVKDPAGNEVFIDPDSSYLLQEWGKLVFYTINPETNKRNILVTDGTTSSWLHPTGFDRSLPFTDFRHRKRDELVFGINGVWYITKGTTANTKIFYNSHDINNLYYYNSISEFSSFSVSDFNLAIEAIEKSTGDTISLLHKHSNETTSPLPYRIRVLHDNISFFGQTSGVIFVGSVYDTINNRWETPSIYRETQTALVKLVELEERTKYNVSVVYLNNEFVVDELEDGTKQVYQYINTDTLVNVTSSRFPNYEVLDFFNLKWPYWGPDYPDWGPVSIFDAVWKGSSQTGDIKYFYRNTLSDEYEILNLIDISDADFVFESPSNDTMYYYNYQNTNTGFIRSNFRNGGTISEETEITFDSSFTLNAYNGKFYFGRYNPLSGTIQAITKDFQNDDKYQFIESLSGERIDNPLIFNFLEKKVFIHSRTDDGVKLMVYDPDAIVSLDDSPNLKSILSIYPNPTFKGINIRVDPEFLLASKSLKLAVIDINGKEVLKQPVYNETTWLTLDQCIAGKYELVLYDHNTLVSCHPFIIMRP